MSVRSLSKSFTRTDEEDDIDEAQGDGAAESSMVKNTARDTLKESVFKS